MEPHGDRRKAVKKIIGIERRGALIDNINGRPLPDPTVLQDEEFSGGVEQGEKKAKEKTRDEAS